MLRLRRVLIGWPRTPSSRDGGSVGIEELFNKVKGKKKKIDGLSVLCCVVLCCVVLY